MNIWILWGSVFFPSKKVVGWKAGKVDARRGKKGRKHWRNRSKECYWFSRKPRWNKLQFHRNLNLVKKKRERTGRRKSESLIMNFNDTAEWKFRILHDKQTRVSYFTLTKLCMSKSNFTASWFYLFLMLILKEEEDASKSNSFIM